MRGYVRVNVEIDEVLKDIESDDLIECVEDRGFYVEEEPRQEIHQDLVWAYFHGDFNMKKFFKEIGTREVEKVLEDIRSGG